MKKQKALPTSFRLRPIARQQLDTLEAAGYGSQVDIVHLALDAYFHQYQQQHAVTVVSRQVAESSAEQMPEIVEIDGKPWLNLGSGLLAEFSAQMLQAQIAGTEVQRNGLDEVLVYNGEAAADNYASIKVIIMWKFV